MVAFAYKLLVIVRLMINLCRIFPLYLHSEGMEWLILVFSWWVFVHVYGSAIDTVEMWTFEILKKMN